MKAMLLLFILFFINIDLRADADSLKNLLNNTGGKKRIALLIELMEKIEREDPAAALAFGDEAARLLRSYPDKILETEVLYRKGWIYIHRNNLDSARIFADLTGKIAVDNKISEGELMKLHLLARIARMKGLSEDALALLDSAMKKNEELRNKLFEINFLNERGAVFRRLGKFNDALAVHTKALTLLEEYPDDEELRATLTYLGIINDILGRYDEALKFHHRSLEISKQLSDERSVAGSFHNLGVLNQKLEKYNEALDYYNRALDYWKYAENKEGLASTLNSIGAVHELLSDFNEALKYYKQAYEIWKDSGTKFSISIALHNIGASYYYLGDYKKALGYLEKTIAIRREIKDKNGAAGTLMILASVYDKLGNFSSAINTAKEGSDLAIENGSWSSIRHAHRVLAEIYEHNGYYKEALDEFKKYQAAHDSMFNTESQQVIAEMQEKYKSDEQKKQIELLQKDNQIQTLYRTILIAGIVLLLLILILLYSRYKLKKRSHETFQQLHESEVERANLRTEAAETKAAIIQVQFDQKTKELNAARELQLSMLPAVIPHSNKISIAASMNTATEVGGDYYDFYKSEDGCLTIAIGDATGHGVKAGIMVTAVKSLFNLLAPEQDLVNILCRSTQAIRKMHMKNLFMAFALLRIKDNYLESAGAGMPPMYIYRSINDEIEEVALKGLPLGIAEGYEYTSEKTKLNSGDAVIIMSDGFPELFNKEKENLGYEKIPLLLKDSGDKSPEEIINYFKSAADQWLDGIQQQDDMTFVVLKIT